MKGQAEAISKEMAALWRTLVEISSSNYQTPMGEMPPFQFHPGTGECPTTSTPKATLEQGAESEEDSSGAQSGKQRQKEPRCEERAHRAQKLWEKRLMAAE